MKRIREAGSEPTPWDVAELADVGHALRGHDIRPLQEQLARPVGVQALGASA